MKTGAAILNHMGSHPFLRSFPFSQSKHWQAFQHELGKNTRALEGHGWHCLLIEQSTKLGKYWAAHHGPIVQDQEALLDALQSIKDAASKEDSAWVTIEPWGINISPSSLKQLRPAYKNYNPPHTSVIDLKKGEDELRRNLSPTFRNLINRAETRGLSFKTSSEPKDVELFLNMKHEVEKNNRMRLHDDFYFRTQAATLMPFGVLRLEIAAHNSEPVATALIIDHDNTASYVYAASWRKARKLEPGTVLLWHAIKEAKNRGKGWFDLFGVAPANAPSSHPWTGFSTFKRKFGGEDIELSGTWDMPIDKKRYLAYRSSLPLIRRLQNVKSPWRITR